MSETPPPPFIRVIDLVPEQDDSRPRWFVDSRVTNELLNNDAALRSYLAGFVPYFVKRETATVERCLVWDDYDPTTKSWRVIVTGRGDKADE